MAATIVITATDLASNLERYENEARKSEVAIALDGRVCGYFVSVQQYAELQRLRRFARRVYRVGNLPTELARALRASKMDPAHAHLNSLLERDRLDDGRAR